MSILGNFNASDYENPEDYSPIPVGDYLAAITEATEAKTKDYTGDMLKLTFTILDGKYKGRKVWENLNLVNRNPDTVAIAKRQLAMLCRAINVLSPNNPAMLQGKPMTIKVAIEPAKDGYKEKNEISGYYPAIPVQAQAPAAPVQQAATTAPIWAKQPNVPVPPAEPKQEEIF